MLEQRVPAAAKPTKAILPAWLVEELGKQGFRFDSSGRPDMSSTPRESDNAF
jgi:hypothetical protein